MRRTMRAGRLVKRSLAALLAMTLVLCGVPTEALAEISDELGGETAEAVLPADDEIPADTEDDAEEDFMLPDGDVAADEDLVFEDEEPVVTDEDAFTEDELTEGIDEADEASEALPVVEEEPAELAAPAEDVTETDDAEEADDESEPAKAAAQPSGPNLTAALKKYPVDKGSILEATTASEIVSQLAMAADIAVDVPCIVHVPNGTYNISSLKVASNVLLVSEDGAKYVETTSGTTAMVKLSGSLYGGSFDAKSKAVNVVRFDKVAFSGRNGIVEKITAVNAVEDGILTTGLGCDNAQAIKCVAKNNGKSGICALHDSSYKLISGCRSEHNGYSKESGYSGINLSHSDVGRIENCYVAYNRDKGISANSDYIKGCTHPGCNIGVITGCTFVGNMRNGVYLKPKCHVDEFTNNTLKKNKDGLSCVGQTPAGTKGTSYAKVVKNNKFENNETSSICVQYPGATITLGDNNTITGAKKNCIIAQNGGNVVLAGSGIVISKAKWAGIRTTKTSSYKGKTKSNIKITGTGVVIKNCGSSCIDLEQGKLTISGKGTKIYGAKVAGILVNPKSVLKITGSNTVIQKNGTRGIHETKATVKITGKGTTIKSNKRDGVFAEGGKVTITGKKTSIKSNKGRGILANNKAKVTYKKKNVKLKKNKQGATAATGGAKIKKK